MRFSFLTKIGIILIPIFIIGYVVNQQIRPIAKIELAKKGTAIDAISGTIEVKAEIEMDIRSEQGGRIIKSNLKEGLQVVEGEVLLQVDTEGLELEKRQSQLKIETLEERLRIGNPKRRDLKNLEEDFEVFEKQSKDGTFSLKELERKKREIESLKDEIETERLADEEALEGEKINLQTVERRIAQATVKAPIDGVLTKVYAYKGDLLAPNSPVAGIISKERRIEAKISEENFSGIVPGQSALVRFLSYQRQTFNGAVVQVLDSADPLTQKYTLFLDVDIDGDLLIPGLTGETSITRGRRVDSLLIPRRALRGNLVFVVDEDHIVRVRPVEHGYLSLNHAEILEGLKEGEMVIVDGHERFRDGDRVRIAK